MPQLEDAGPGQPPRLWKSGRATGSSYSTSATTRHLAVQSKVSGMPGWMACSMHEVHYRQERRECPMCAQDEALAKMIRDREHLQSKIEVAARDMATLKARVSHLDEMRLAIDVMSDGDLLAIKEIIYRWQRMETRIDIATRAVKFSSPNGAGVRHEVRGLRAGPVEHFCDSVGGVAMARAFSEAIKLVGRDGAAMMLVQAMSSHISHPSGVNVDHSRS